MEHLVMPNSEPPTLSAFNALRLTQISTIIRHTCRYTIDLSEVQWAPDIGYGVTENNEIRMWSRGYFPTVYCKFDCVEWLQGQALFVFLAVTYSSTIQGPSDQPLSD